MRTGVHCSVRKGFVAALEDADALGCETLQIFTQNPRGWMTRVFDELEFIQFRRRREKLGMGPVVVHSPYLPNLCTSDPALYARSLHYLRQDLGRCEKLGAEFLVIHPGAYSPGSDYQGGLKKLIAALNDALENVKGTSRILIENMAGGGRRLGSTAREIADMLNGVRNQDRIGVCFDTCHALGAGYNLSTEEGVDATVSEFQKEIGLDRIFVFHVNDSKAVLGSHRDIHEHLGKGRVGEAGLKRFLANPAFRERAFILETPKWPAPQSDLENLKILRSFFN